MEAKNTFIISYILLSLTFIGVLFSRNVHYKEKAEAEQLTQDSLMAIKQISDRTIFRLQDKIGVLQAKNNKLSNQIKILEKR